MSVHEFLDVLNQSIRQKDANAFSQCFVFSTSSAVNAKLSSKLPQDPKGKNKLKSEIQKNFGKIRGWKESVLSYLEFVDKAALGEPISCWSSLQAVYVNLTTCFAHLDGAWLVPIIKSVSIFYVNLSIQLDRESPQDSGVLDTNGFLERNFISEASRNVQRTFNIILSDRQPNVSPSKKDAIFTISNLLYKLYFRLKQIRLCQTIQANVLSSGVSINQATSAEIVTFRYYLGRCHLFQHKIHQAETHLKSAFLSCPDEYYKQKRLILIYLTTCGLILGKSPRLQYLEKYSLIPMFQSLIVSMKKGDIHSFHLSLEDVSRRNWFIKHGIFLTLHDRCEIVIWRNLFRKVFFMTFQNAQKTPHVNGQFLLEAALLSTQDQTFDIDDVECICVSLIDQGYIKGYMIHSSATLVLKKDTSFGFAPIESVMPVVGKDRNEEEFFQRN
ncbi:nuclear pore associated protein Thp1-Sac3 complex subunit [Schizosaccharomyces cryophilus OY26]|uniref:Nuclear pore associated protein Thp1-Sac3 complex subunit n=1 Tax=Schizosaccharomyces cryophilus (strain OY26 / ATCC MYA-4695 / CBS 11777 / NBRC 106824 / NRRL Y48691) TaxID=653667 RepID=S9W191_SCHCR|nr:nuclear pore associated protein Thp1-Sac3 complex subunit [Schizosaccharomyces cryophilus OY26]EPY53763.1 nuclear pore associated protein Thp1-Sac3 complex subunit [Schizosaccharomyces cryophilus OY26]